MLLATAATGVALPYQSATWLSVAAVVSLVCGWAAARIVYAELAQSWREATADRAAQANAYRTMFSQRADEHAAFTSVMADRLRRRDGEIHELEESVLAAEKRAFEAEARVQREVRRADGAVERAEELVVRVDELQRAHDHLEAARGMLEEELAAVEAGHEASPFAQSDGAHEGVADLVAWEERVAAAHRPETEQQQA